MTARSPAPIAAQAVPLVTRSDVAPGKKYNEYREDLRHDFFCSCAYCTLMEAEATAIRFVIDHYEPRASRPDLENQYSNLMYACDECNTLKGDRCPPSKARVDGLRFFRPDEDIYDQHFEESGRLLSHKTATGWYTIQSLELNRLSLRRIRELRERLAVCHEFVAAGIAALRKFHIDRLPKNIRSIAISRIREAQAAADRLEDDIDALLRRYARSPLIDIDPDAEKRAQERAAQARRWKALYPGKWRSRDET